VLDVEKIKTGLLRITQVNNKIAHADIVEENQTDKIAVSHMVKSISGPLVDEYDYQGNAAAGAAPSVARTPVPVAVPLSADAYIAKLRSPNFKDKKWSAKKIVRDKVKDPAVFAVVEEVLMAIYADKPRGRDKYAMHIDTVAWLCKALGSSQMSEYKETLRKIYESRVHKKIRKHAKAAYKSLK
jgi:hypothetical protein